LCDIDVDDDNNDDDDDDDDVNTNVPSILELGFATLRSLPSQEMDFVLIRLRLGLQ